MIDWRTTPDGVLFAPARGKAPACPSGFEQVPGNKYSFHPIITCQHRQVHQIKRGCCKTCVAYYCQLKAKYQLQSICRKCNERTIPDTP